jgi:hypothetical protein
MDDALTVTLSFDLGIFVPEAAGKRRTVTLTKSSPQWKRAVEIARSAFKDAIPDGTEKEELASKGGA